MAITMDELIRRFKEKLDYRHHLMSGEMDGGVVNDILRKVQKNLRRVPIHCQSEISITCRHYDDIDHFHVSLYLFGFGNVPIKTRSGTVIANTSEYYLSVDIGEEKIELDIIPLNNSYDYGSMYVQLKIGAFENNSNGWDQLKDKIKEYI